MANEREPDNPLPVDFVPDGAVETHRVSDGEDWASVAAQYNVNVNDLIYFNFQTNVPEEVNWYLRRNVGCDVSNDGGRNWAFSSSADPGLIYIPPSEVIEMEPEEVTDETTAQSEEQSAEDQLAETSEGELVDQAIRNKLELDLQSVDVTPATAKTGDCSSWENDPRSFAKAIADNYLSTEFDHMPGLVAPEGVSCWSSQPGGKVSDFCYVHYSDGWNVIVSLSNIPDYVKARATAPERKPMCTYSYDCTDTGTLSFTRRGCYP
jgi:hypothetical protein